MHSAKSKAGRAAYLSMLYLPYEERISSAKHLSLILNSKEAFERPKEKNMEISSRFLRKPFALSKKNWIQSESVFRFFPEGFRTL